MVRCSKLRVQQEASVKTRATPLLPACTLQGCTRTFSTHSANTAPARTDTSPAIEGGQPFVNSPAEAPLAGVFVGSTTDPCRVLEKLGPRLQPLHKRHT
jgi:hypothetical protein